MQFMVRLMDWTLEDNMVNSLIFFATLTSCRSGHAPFVQTGAEMSNTSTEAVEPNPRCSLEGYSRRWVWD